MALEDGLMHLNEGLSNVLVGATDEYIPFLDTFFERINTKLPYPLTSGTTFCSVSFHKLDSSLAKVVDTQTFYGSNNMESVLSGFLSQNNVVLTDIDLILFASPYHTKEIVDLGITSINISEYAGLYASNSAFGFHVAADKIATQGYKKVLVVNNLIKENIGLTLLSQI